jgi:ribose 5-phosphate isomerase B
MKQAGPFKLIFASDHAGAELQSKLLDYANSQGHSCIEIGKTAGESVDYPDVVQEALTAFQEHAAQYLILTCGSGIGVSISANRDPNIRAVLALNPSQAQMARAHNHANCLCLAGRSTSFDAGKKIFDAFLEGSEDRADRHCRRVRKLGDL